VLDDAEALGRVAEEVLVRRGQHVGVGEQGAAGEEQHRGDDEAEAPFALARVQAGGDELPDLAEDERRGDEDADDERQLEEHHEAFVRREHDELAAAERGRLGPGAHERADQEREEVGAEGIGDDGAIDEGPGYWFDAVGRLYDGLTIIESATMGRISLFKEPITRLLASYIYKTHIAGNFFVSIADAYPRLYPDGLMLYRFGKAVGDTNMQNFGAYFFHKGGDFFDKDEFTMADRLWDFTVMKNCDKVKGKEPLLKDVWLKSIELMISRSDKGLFVASHGGHNAESHNHNDVGDVVLYAYGEPVIIDVGSGTYTSQTFSENRYKLWYNSSAYHNVPLINGYQQKEGAQFKAKNVLYKADVSKTELEMDIAAAYPAEAGITRWIRNISVRKKSNRLTIKDRYTAVAPLKELTQTFMTVCPVDLRQAGKIFFDVAGKKVLMEYDANVWNASKEEALQHTPDEKRLEENWNHQTIWRLLLTAKKPAQKANFMYTFRMDTNE